MTTYININLAVVKQRNKRPKNTNRRCEKYKKERTNQRILRLT